MALVASSAIVPSGSRSDAYVDEIRIVRSEASCEQQTNVSVTDSFPDLCRYDEVSGNGPVSTGPGCGADSGVDDVRGRLHRGPTGDVDGDGVADLILGWDAVFVCRGWPSTVDNDGDGLSPARRDCADADPDNHAAPSVVVGLAFSGVNTLEWLVPVRRANSTT